MIYVINWQPWDRLGKDAILFGKLTLAWGQFPRWGSWCRAHSDSPLGSALTSTPASAGASRRALSSSALSSAPLASSRGRLRPFMERSFLRPPSPSSSESLSSLSGTMRLSSAAWLSRSSGFALSSSSDSSRTASSGIAKKKKKTKKCEDRVIVR